MNKYIASIYSFVVSIIFMVGLGCSLSAVPNNLDAELEKLMSDPAFQQEMERMNQMLEADPALKAEVERIAADPAFQQELQQMFEDPAFQEEFTKELSRMQEVPEYTAPSQQFQPGPSKPTEPSKKEEPKKIVRDMKPTIDSINVLLENFMQKTSVYLDIASNFEKWVEKRRIDLGSGMTWNIFKDKVEKLKKSLYEIKAVDVNTQKPKFLADLSANEGLCNNLEKFKSDLARNESTIVVKLGKDVTSASKNAIINVINACLSAISTLKIQDELEKIIVKYDPIAKKLKEEEDKKEKAAIATAQRRPGQPAPARMAMRGGQEAQGYYQEGLPSGDRGHGGFGGASPYYPGAGYPGSTPFGEPSKQDTGKGSGVGKKPEEKKEAPKKAEAPKKEEDKQAAGIEKALDKMEDALSDKLNQVDISIDDALENVAAKLKDPKKKQEFIGELKNLAVALKTLGRTDVAKLRSNIWDLTGSKKSEYLKVFQDLWKDYKTGFNIKQKKLQSLDASKDADLKEAVDNVISELGSLNDKFLLLEKKPTGGRKHPRTARKEVK